jgi:hypothetical protein
MDARFKERIFVHARGVGRWVRGGLVGLGAAFGVEFMFCALTDPMVAFRVVTVPKIHDVSFVTNFVFLFVARFAIFESPIVVGMMEVNLCRVFHFFTNDTNERIIIIIVCLLLLLLDWAQTRESDMHRLQDHSCLTRSPMRYRNHGRLECGRV